MCLKLWPFASTLKDRAEGEGSEWPDLVWKPLEARSVERVRSSLRCDFREGPLSGITKRFPRGSARLGQIVNARDGGEIKVTSPV